MKRLLIFLITLTAVISCDNELELIEEKKDIPIVYGLLSVSDTAQYIRVERAFVDETQSAFELAMDPGALYYPDAVVQLERASTGSLFSLTRVDGTEEGYPRDAGAFAQFPNYLYKIRNDAIDLVPGENYILRINRGDNQPEVTASSILIEDARIIRPTNTGSLDFDYIQGTNFRWSGGEGAVIFDIYLKINYRERNVVIGGNFESKSVLWQMGQSLVNQELEVVGIDFYGFLGGAIPVDTDVDRRMDDVDVILDSGGEEIREYIQVGSANLGITSSQDIPTYSNLSEGRGIFSSRNRTWKYGVPLTPGTIDSLVDGTITRDLNFRR